MLSFLPIHSFYPTNIIIFATHKSRNHIMQRSKYLVASKRDKAWGLTVSTVGLEEVLPEEPYPTRGHAEGYYFNTDKGRVLQEYQLIYIASGEGLLSTSHVKSIHIREGDAFFLFPGEWHTYHPLTNAGWKSYWIGFKGTNMDSRVKAGFLSKEKPVYHVGQSVEITYLYETAIRIADEEQAFTQQMLAGIINHLIGLVYSLERKYSLRLEGTNVILIDQARILIRQNLDKNLSMQDIARKLNCSYSNFRRLFREHMGVSPVQYQQDLRLQQACELVAYTDKPIKEIAFQLHFESPDYFSTKFKKKTGYTPKEYRLLTNTK